MSEPRSNFLNLGDPEVVDNDPVVDDDSDVKGEPERVDLGNHEADEVKEPPTVNDKGELVDSDGNKVFTTNEEALKDGSMVLDEKGRQPGIYLDDLEAEQNELRRKRYEEAFGKAKPGQNVVERQVNVVNSPMPPVTVPIKQENPLPDEPVTHESDVVEESDTAKVG